MNTHPTHSQGSLLSYCLGFGLSIVLTLAAFGLLVLHNSNHHVWPTHIELMYAFVALAMLQLLGQLAFFLHLGRGSSRRWNIAVMLIAGLLVFIFVGGSLWIMANLTHAGMPYTNGQITPQAEQD